MKLQAFLIGAILGLAVLHFTDFRTPAYDFGFWLGTLTR